MTNLENAVLLDLSVVLKQEAEKRYKYHQRKAEYEFTRAFRYLWHRQEQVKPTDASITAYVESDQEVVMAKELLNQAQRDYDLARADIEIMRVQVNWLSSQRSPTPR